MTDLIRHAFHQAMNGEIPGELPDDHRTSIEYLCRTYVDDHRPPAPEIDKQAISLDDLLDTEEEPYDWLLEGLIERGDRIILTGQEGKGKSTLLRQLGAQFAAGIHPFNGTRFDPLNVLYVDCENSRRQVRRKVDRLRDATGRGALLKFVFRPDGINLTIVQHVAWLEQLIIEQSPDVLMIGPVYKMASGDPKDEQAAKVVSDCLDHLRNRFGFALFMEAHTPYAEGSKSKRPERPYGASLWSRWPEFGMYLHDDGHIRHWRGQRDERSWPAKLMHGDGEWPWVVDHGDNSTVPTEPWMGPVECMDAIMVLLKSASPTEFGVNEMIKQLQGTGRGYRRAVVSEAAEQLAMENRIDVRTGPRNSRIYRFTATLLGPADEEF